jgi:transcriptional regulator with XRE-family HTH domain
MVYRFLSATLGPSSFPPMSTPSSAGPLVRTWRRRRRQSQADLAADAEISARHLSFIETGRSVPSREVLLRLADCLEVPLREQNALLVAAGYAPRFPERPLSSAALADARRAVEAVLRGFEPYPALAVDRRWELVAANRAVAPLLEGADPALVAPPMNVLRLALHPLGLAGRTENYAEWRGHLLARLGRQAELSANADLAALLDELRALPPPPGVRSEAAPEVRGDEVAVPFRLRTPAGVLSFYSTTTVFGTPVDVTLAELAVEAFLPANEETARVLQGAPPGGAPETSPASA